MSASVEGHQLSTFLARNGYKNDWIDCTCGWTTGRQIKLVPLKNGGTKEVKEKLEEMRERGRVHLYEAWRSSRQGVLEV